MGGTISYRVFQRCPISSHQQPLILETRSIQKNISYSNKLCKIYVTQVGDEIIFGRKPSRKDA